MEYNILIVDDNENNRYTLKTLLKELDVSVYEAANGSQGLGCLLKNEIDLIILDIQLPDYDGFQVAKMIKNRKKTMSIPIIFATAVFKSEEFILKGYELGAIDYVIKPFDIHQMLTKVRYYKSVDFERRKLVNTLKTQNEKLYQSVEALNSTQELLVESVENWRLLGENIPYSVEIYDNECMLVFGNNNTYDASLLNLHQEYEREIEKQISKTLLNKMSIITTHQIDFSGEIMFYEVKSIYVRNKANDKVMLIISDVTQQKKRLDGISYIGYHDQLTGLWNRHYFAQYMATLEIEQSIPFTLMMADVNGLKLINDGFGHTAGDELIKAVSECLKISTPSECVISRWGGDEFLLLLPNTDESEAKAITQKINENIQGERIGDKFPVSMALGKVTCHVEHFDLEHLIKLAEDKMYVNKMQNQSSYRSFIVESLKGALFEQDFETKEHTERIGKMALVVSDHLNLNQNDKDKLILLGSLHDIGKIGILSSVLTQGEKLSEIDWNIIRRHPEIGYRICIGVPELSGIADLILSHHERWDGTGYPRRLKGTEIPMLARLISILDTFDVITHDRPYKKKKPHEWALKEIKRCSGTQFDPNLVTVFEHVYKDLIALGEDFDFNEK